MFEVLSLSAKLLKYCTKICIKTTQIANKIKLILHGTLNKEFKLEQKRSEIEVNFVIEINYYQKYP